MHRNLNGLVHFLNSIEAMQIIASQKYISFISQSFPNNIFMLSNECIGLSPIWISRRKLKIQIERGRKKPTQVISLKKWQVYSAVNRNDCRTEWFAVC